MASLTQAASAAVQWGQAGATNQATTCTSRAQKISCLKPATPTLVRQEVLGESLRIHAGRNGSQRRLAVSEKRSVGQARATLATEEPPQGMSGAGLLKIFYWPLDLNSVGSV